MLKEGIHKSKVFVANEVIGNCYQKQCQIGWNQIYLGRFHNEWVNARDPNKDTLYISNLPQIIKIMWEYGLKLWGHRNQQLHGGIGGVSKIIFDRVQRVAAAAADVLKNDISYDHRWILSQPAPNNDQQGYSNTIAWLDSVRRLYPEKYKTAREQANVSESLSKEIIENYIPKNTVSGI